MDKCSQRGERRAPNLGSSAEEAEGQNVGCGYLWRSGRLQGRPGNFTGQHCQDQQANAKKLHKEELWGRCDAEEANRWLTPQHIIVPTAQRGVRTCGPATFRLANGHGLSCKYFRAGRYVKGEHLWLLSINASLPATLSVLAS